MIGNRQIHTHFLVDALELMSSLMHLSIRSVTRDQVNWPCAMTIQAALLALRVSCSDSKANRMDLANTSGLISQRWTDSTSISKPNRMRKDFCMGSLTSTAGTRNEVRAVEKSLVGPISGNMVGVPQPLHSSAGIRNPSPRYEIGRASCRERV